MHELLEHALRTEVGVGIHLKTMLWNAQGRELGVADAVITARGFVVGRPLIAAIEARSENLWYPSRYVVVAQNVQVASADLLRGHKGQFLVAHCPREFTQDYAEVHDKCLEQILQMHDIPACLGVGFHAADSGRLGSGWSIKGT